MKAWRDDLASRLDEAGKSLKKTIGVTYQELLDLPQGAVSIAVVRSSNAKLPVAFVLTADAGKNAAAMEDVLAKATKTTEDNGAKVATEVFKGATLHVIKPVVKKDGGKDAPDAPVVWTQEGGTFFVGSDLDAVKDLVAHAEGRGDSLATNASFVQAQKKLGDDGQVVWFLDLSKVLDLALQAGSKGNPGQAQQAQALIQMTGLQGLKAAAGTFVLNAGNFDTISKILVLAPQPSQGVLQIFQFPKAPLRPESWVPASVSSYATYSWDLDNAFKAIDNLVNKIQPGMLQVFEQQLVGPNGDPLDFQKDIFGPLGNRITVINDFKKPISEENQRMLLAVALQDSKAFQNTLKKLIALANGAPQKREFQGTTIFDFDLPQMPNNPNGAALKGTISVAVAKDTLFVSREPTLLESVLRGGGPGLVDSASFQGVAKEIPSAVSSLSYIRPEEQARVSYDMIKSGRFEKALENAAVAGGPNMAGIAKIIDKEKLPDFSIFAKYLSQGGGYGVQDEDGVTMTSFTLRKANP